MLTVVVLVVRRGQRRCRGRRRGRPRFVPVATLVAVILSRGVAGARPGGPLRAAAAVGRRVRRFLGCVRGRLVAASTCARTERAARRGRGSGQGLRPATAGARAGGGRYGSGAVGAGDGSRWRRRRIARRGCARLDRCGGPEATVRRQARGGRWRGPARPEEVGGGAGSRWASASAFAGRPASRRRCGSRAATGAATLGEAPASVQPHGRTVERSRGAVTAAGQRGGESSCEHTPLRRTTSSCSNPSLADNSSHYRRSEGNSEGRRGSASSSSSCCYFLAAVAAAAGGGLLGLLGAVTRSVRRGSPTPARRRPAGGHSRPTRRARTAPTGSARAHSHATASSRGAARGGTARGCARRAARAPTCGRTTGRSLRSAAPPVDAPLSAAGADCRAGAELGNASSRPCRSTTACSGGLRARAVSTAASASSLVGPGGSTAAARRPSARHARVAPGSLRRSRRGRGATAVLASAERRSAVRPARRAHAQEQRLPANRAPSARVFAAAAGRAGADRGARVHQGRSIVRTLGQLVDAAAPSRRAGSTSACPCEGRDEFARSDARSTRWPSQLEARLERARGRAARVSATRRCASARRSPRPTTPRSCCV